MSNSPAGTAGLFQLTVRLRGQPPRALFLSSFPYTVGRSVRSDLRLELPGVWDSHLRFELHRGEGLVVVSCDPNALVRRGDETITRARVRGGDTFEVGACSIAVSIGPVRRKYLGFWDAFLAVTLVAVAAAQFGLGWWLLSGSVP